MLEFLCFYFHKFVVAWISSVVSRVIQSLLLIELFILLKLANKFQKYSHIGFMLLKIQLKWLKKCLAINCCHFLNFIFAANTVIQTVKKNYFIFSKSSTFLVISIFTFCLCISERLFALWISIPFTSTWYNMEKVRHCMNSPPLFLTTFPVNVLIDLVNVWIYTTVKWYFQGIPSLNISED